MFRRILNLCYGEAVVGEHDMRCSMLLQRGIGLMGGPFELAVAGIITGLYEASSRTRFRFQFRTLLSPKFSVSIVLFEDSVSI